MQTRRAFVKLGTTGGAGLYLTSTLGSVARLVAQVPGGTLPPKVIPKFVTPLVIPPAMPLAGSDSSVDYYRIAVRQFRQQILPAPLPRTTVWGYGAVDHPATFNYPAFTINATADRATRVTWINQLVDGRGRYLPHLLAVDQTLHWANPPGGIAGRDDRGADAEPYAGPVPIVTHLHGGHTGDESDGFAEAWFLPQANNIPDGYATEGTWYQHFKDARGTPARRRSTIRTISAQPLCGSMITHSG
jgi:bilirubin oxidase